MTIEAVRKRVEGGKDRTTEFLVDLNSPDRIARTVCSFLNSEGGAIYCGVDDVGSIVGLQDSTLAQAQELELALKQAVTPTALFTVERMKLDDRDLLIVEVPEGRDRPYVVDGAVWLRRGPETIAADAGSLKALMQEQVEAPMRWERRISPSMSIEDLDLDEVRATVREVEALRRFGFTKREDDLAVLDDLSVYTRGAFTQGGDVLFSRSPSRRHPQCRVQFLRIAQDKSADQYQDIRWFEGPLARVVKELSDAVSAAIPMRATFISGESRRLNQSAYDRDAIREGVVNAFVHRDYSAYSGGLRVTMFENRIEIWNSGRLPKELKPSDLRRDHPSILVNPDIANVFYLRDLMERIGRGTEKIVKASKELGARPPLWLDSPTGVTLTIFASTPTDTGKPVKLNDRQNRLLIDLHPGDELTPREYHSRYAAGVTGRQARRDLEELEKLGWLRRSGQTRTTKYVLS